MDCVACVRRLGLVSSNWMGGWRHPARNPLNTILSPRKLTNTGASGGPESEGKLDQLMAALNFLRFLMLKDPREVSAWAESGGV